MKSRFLSRLEADIRGATDLVDADCLRCERAAYLARLGDGASAANELAEVQRRHAARPNALISAWVHFAEALVGHYGHQAPQSHDRMKRANALSAAVGHKPLQALSAAWLGHFEYMGSRPAALARNAAQALAMAEPTHHAARARACLVVAQSYHDGGRFDLARPWYDEAHRHATTEGDDTTLSAIMWNMTALRVTALQQAEACGPSHAGGGGDHARASTESTARWDEMLGMSSLSELSPVLHAQLFTVLGQTTEALQLYEAHLDAALAQGFGRIEGGLRADRAWCRLQAGQQQAARDDAELAEQCLQRPGGWSDRAIGHSRLAQIYGALGDGDAAQRQAELAASAWEGYRTMQAQLVDALDRELDRTE